MFDQRSYIWTFSMGKCLNMPKVWVQSWGSFPLALAAEIVPKKVEWNDSLKKPGLLILAIYVEANNE